MKIQEFMNNPAGKGAFIPGKDMVISNYNYRLGVLLKNKKIVMKIYTSNEDVYYHLLIPTESEEKENTYDVIVKFKATEQSNLLDKSYKQYDIEFFSNCPSFTYTYAYVAKLNGILIPEFSDKYDEITLSMPPVSRNPGLTFGYEKSVYFACKFLLSNNQFLLKSYVKTHGKPLTKNVIKSIRKISIIEEEIKKESNKRKKNKKNEKKTNKPKETNKINSTNKKQNVSGVNTIKKKSPNNNKINKIQPIKKKK